jgi:hypothetical protein
MCNSRHNILPAVGVDVPVDQFPSKVNNAFQGIRWLNIIRLCPNRKTSSKGLVFDEF